MKLNERAILADAILNLQDNLKRGIEEVASAIALVDSKNETGFTSEYLRNFRRNPTDINKVSKDFGSHIALLEHKNYQTKLKLIDKETELVSLECFVTSYEEAREKINEHLAKLEKIILIVVTSKSGKESSKYAVVKDSASKWSKNQTIDTSKDDSWHLWFHANFTTLCEVAKLLNGKEPDYTLTLIVE